MAAEKTIDSYASQWTHDYSKVPFSKLASNEWYLPGLNEEDIAHRYGAEEDFRNNGELRSPNVEYPHLNWLSDDHFHETERSYQDLLKRALDLDDANESELLYERAARKLAELYRHKQIIRMHGGRTDLFDANRATAGDMTREIFNDIEQDAFAHLLTDLRSQAETCSDESYAQELLALTNPVEHNRSIESYELHETTIENIRSDLFTLFPELRDLLIVDSDIRISPEEAVSHYEAFLDSLGMSEEGWRVKLGGGKAARTQGSQKMIIVGQDREDYRADSLNGVRFHEIIGHGLRSFLAKRQPNPICRTALPGSLDFEEGFATALEQIITGERRVVGSQYYLALGLQLGLDQGGRERDFRDVYEILWRREAIIAKQLHKDLDISKAQTDAYTQTMRTMRGGALDARDSSYFVGSKKANTWLNQISSQDESARLEQLRWVLSGLFDPTDTNQATLVETTL